MHRGVPVFVRLDPACVDLRFLERLRHVSLNSFDVIRGRHRLRLAIRLHWPGAQNGLVKQIFFVRIGRFQIIHQPFPTVICSAPALQRTPPKLRDFGDCNDSRTDVFAAFCVVRRRGEQRRGPVALPINVSLVKHLDAKSKLLRLATDFI
ncbi:MAG: hypothetical protein Udaeo_06390 [Candidatus Udaeobacter sp.]|nr:MAG: hypothetical protein Udaeo_06390 [Candidatus Udaeobacter sp.]